MKNNFPSFFFIRSYVAIVIGILVIAIALDAMLDWLPEDNSAAGNAGRYRDSFALINQVILDGPARGNITAAFAARREQLQQALGLELTLYREEDFAGLEGFLRDLEARDIIPLYDSAGREVLYQRIPGSEHILALGPLPPDSGRGGRLEILANTAYYCLVATIIFLWVRPFYRDLSRLRSAAGKFGRNDFSTRVSLPASSSILPVARSFNTMAERIEYLVSAHRELTNAVSHELRTPLARFKFSLQILSGTEDSDKKARYLRSMREDVQELETLIDEMLSYARLSEQNLQMERADVNVRNWLQEEVRTYGGAEIPLQSSFHAAPEDPGRAHFNPGLMARALHNVLRNCLRYADNSIVLGASLNDSMVSLRICDDGPGIPEDMRQKIFEPFSRLDTSRDRQSGGYGLGLAIACRILERHGGSITVENCAPRGACFILQWPRHGGNGGNGGNGG